MSVKDTFRVNSGFGDPVEGDVNLATYNGNAFYGCYGYGRDEGRTSHKGFDYLTKELSEEGKGDVVVAVGKGEIVRVRFGHPSGECGHSKNKTNNSFVSTICRKCSNIRSCYGVHLWLKLYNTDNYYALYAHLSELSETIISQIPNNKENTVNLNPIIVDKGFVIGKSGRTGAAAWPHPENSGYNGYKYPPHLHFECRKGIGTIIPENHKNEERQISPNNVVHTKFYVMKDVEPVFDDADNTTVWSKIGGVLQKKWKIIHDNIKKWKISKSNQKYNKYAKKAAMSVSEMVIPILDFEFVNHPKEQCLDSYETITNTTKYDLEDVSDKENISIEPYQIIKKTKVSFSTKRGLSHTYVVDEYDIVEEEIKTCSNQTNLMPWQSK